MYKILYMLLFLVMVYLQLCILNRSFRCLDDIIEKLKTIDPEAYDFMRTRNKRYLARNKTVRLIFEKYADELRADILSYERWSNALNYFAILTMIAFAGIPLVLY